MMAGIIDGWERYATFQNNTGNIHTEGYLFWMWKTVTL